MPPSETPTSQDVSRITLRHDRVELATAERRVDLDVWFAARPARGGTIRDVPHGLAYLHFVRMPPHVLDFYASTDWRLGPGTPDELRERLVARFERSYAESLPALRAAYRELFDRIEYDAVLRPPSRRDDARPYLEEACAARPGAFNLSLGLSQVATDADRPPRAGHRDERPRFRESLRVSPSLRTVLPSIERLLIVDDTFADGTTIAGWWEALRAAGLSPLTRLVAACPVRTTTAAV